MKRIRLLSGILVLLVLSLCFVACVDDPEFSVHGYPVNGTYSGKRLGLTAEGPGVISNSIDGVGEWEISGEWQNNKLNGHANIKFNGDTLVYHSSLNKDHGLGMHDSTSFSKEPTVAIDFGYLTTLIADNWACYQVDTDRISIEMPEYSDFEVFYERYPGEKNFDFTEDIVEAYHDSLDLSNEASFFVPFEISGWDNKDSQKYYIFSFNEDGIKQHYIHFRKLSADNSIHAIHYITNDFKNHAQIVDPILHNMGSYEEVKDKLDKKREQQLKAEEQERQAEEQRKVDKMLRGTIDWDLLTQELPTIDGNQIHDSFETKAVIANGVIMNIGSDFFGDLYFDLWMPRGTTFYKEHVKYNPNLDFDEIVNGSEVQVVLPVSEDGIPSGLDKAIAIRQVAPPSYDDFYSYFKQTCPPIDWEGIMRQPDEAYSSVWAATGTIFQIIESTDTKVDFLLELEDGNIVKVGHQYDEGESKLLEGDYLTVYGVFFKQYKYYSLAGERTVPSLGAYFVDVY